MKRRIKKNQKGSVLLTVICFTTVCMLLASTALSLANYSSKVSNNNIRSTQAEITAQNYLQEYINSFAGNYDDLASLAGTSESSPSIVNVSMQDLAGNTISDAGTCQIKIYKSGSGVVVKSEATYAGETEVASAFFEAESTPFSSTNAIETSDSVKGSGLGLQVEGNVQADGLLNNTIKYTDNTTFKGHYYSAGNVSFISSGEGDFFNGADGRAPTFTTMGYIRFTQGTKFTYTSGTRTTDVNGNLLNRDGYIYSDKKVIFTTQGSPTIGTESEPVDVYSRGIIFGAVPQKVSQDAENNVNVTDFDAISSAVGSDGQANSYSGIYGNIYCYKGSNLTYQDGNLIINSGKITINGDIFVEGNIYLTQNNTTLEAKNIYCEGNIYDCKGNKWMPGLATFIGKIQGNVQLGSGAIDRTIQRNVMPDSDYDPSKFDADDPTKQNPTRSSTSIYANATPNNMFIDNTVEAKSIQTLYKDAYNTKIPSEYEQTLDWADNIYVDEACTKPLSDVLRNCTDNNDWNNNEKNKYKTLYVNDSFHIPTSGNKMNISAKIWEDWKGDAYDSTLYQEGELKIVIKVKKDIAVILPDEVNGQYFKIEIDFSEDTINASGNPAHFVHFMLDGGPNGDCYNTTMPSHWTWNFSNNFSLLDNTTKNATEVVASTDNANNIFFLIPDNCEVSLYQTLIKGVLYGPKADVTINGGLNGNTGYAVYGQLLVKSVTNLANGTKVATLLPSEDSILNYINSSATSAVKLQYFTKYKS